jgi:hypothetical protein
MREFFDLATKWNGKKPLRGNIVNVPADIPKILTELARNFKDFRG